MIEIFYLFDKGPEVWVRFRAGRRNYTRKCNFHDGDWYFSFKRHEYHTMELRNYD